MTKQAPLFIRQPKTAQVEPGSGCMFERLGTPIGCGRLSMINNFSVHSTGIPLYPTIISMHYSQTHLTVKIA